jgi:hypothetical protein
MKFKIKTSSYFPKTVRAIGAMFGIFGLAMIWTGPVIGMLFLFIAAVIFTTHYGFEFELNPNNYREFVWVLGWMDGKKIPFKAVDFLFIQRGKFSYLTFTLQERERPAFEGYIKFEGRNEAQVLTDISKDKLINKLKTLANHIGVPILDYSEGNPVQIFSPLKK